MREYEDVPYNVVVIIVPYVLVGECHHRFLLLDVDDLKALLLKVSYR